MRNGLLIVFILLTALTCPAQPFVPGRSLPPWQEGYLDLRHINTVRGKAAFYIFPDGTTMLFDTGELDPSRFFRNQISFDYQ
ncbi:hypothetical protein QWZ08_13735 [Ferruginibacter paludis]|uniref:hypothetical protein n=1 Tax=Ferruginibacter paludis TaxID=1310417 RepID=UPI0025B5B1D9|nr:hypothetical protein [Ferruginibacter paludis]MDN3656701.1 hypothetical protein [Ferruginibacter paludis]